jgi:polyisoprenoid-binding protein YceI
VEHLADDAYRVHGGLTLHGVTRPVALEVTYAGQIADPCSCRGAGFAAEVTLSRKNYGLTYNAVLEAGAVALGEKVKVAIHLQVIRQG